MGNIAPVLFLIFNRPDITREAFNRIKTVRPKYLFIAADGPRSDKPDDALLCNETRKIVDEIDWDCEVKTLFREENIGLRRAVSGAITWFFEHVEQGIILEDDLIPTQSFFSFATEMLNKYKYDQRIFAISGTNYLNISNEIDGSYYFSKYPSSHGWATWQRSWKLYDEFTEWDKIKKSGVIDLLFPDKVEKKFWISIFDKVEQKKIDSWAYIWNYSCFVNSGLNIIPQKNLIKNIGFGEAATHTKSKMSPVFALFTYELTEILHPCAIIQNIFLDKELFYNNHLNVNDRKKLTLFGRFSLFLESMIKWMKRQVKKLLK
ncbi:MAG: nucleotide-diphospho-sugar transferase [Bacteroidales bacterium]|nr:nucleotide-diphospho-sugar transferase [Bacteroidales bacterium]